MCMILFFYKAGILNIGKKIWLVFIAVGELSVCMSTKSIYLSNLNSDQIIIPPANKAFGVYYIGIILSCLFIFLVSTTPPKRMNCY